MIFKVHAKYLMDWINSAFALLCADILSPYGNSTDVHKSYTQDGMFLYDISLCVSLEKRNVYMHFAVSH